MCGICTHAHPRALQRPEGALRCQALALLYSPETGSLTEAGVPKAGKPASPGDPISTSSLAGLQVCTTTPSFCFCFFLWYLNSDLHACIARFLSTKPSISPAPFN